PSAARKWSASCGTSLAECSMSCTNQSKPAPATTSVELGLANVIHSPICGRFSASARLKRFCGRSFLIVLSSWVMARSRCQLMQCRQHGVAHSGGRHRVLAGFREIGGVLFGERKLDRLVEEARVFGAVERKLERHAHT